MRAAFRVAEAAFEPKDVKPYIKGLRATGRALGPVRDLDVFMQEAEEYLAGRPEGEQAGLAPLIGAWREEREVARTKMLAFLAGKRYGSFKDAFQSFLSADGPSPFVGARRQTGTRPGTTGLASSSGRPAPVRVREVALRC